MAARRLLALIVLLVTLVPLAFAGKGSYFSLQPSHTGAFAIGSVPAETNCTYCHFDRNNAPNGANLNTPGGGVEILDLPQYFVPGRIYPLRVRLFTDSTLADPGRLWGFQITAVRAFDGSGIGTFIQPSPDSLQIVSGTLQEFSSRSYLEHTVYDTRDGLVGPVEWHFSWQAPPNEQKGDVYFFCAGNAGNGDFDPGGDFIFTTADTIIDTTTAVRSVSWGALKSRYR
jgi:hypothetical protein